MKATPLLILVVLSFCQQSQQLPASIKGVHVGLINHPEPTKKEVKTSGIFGNYFSSGPASDDSLQDKNFKSKGTVLPNIFSGQSVLKSSATSHRQANGYGNSVLLEKLSGPFPSRDSLRRHHRDGEVHSSRGFSRSRTITDPQPVSSHPREANKRQQPHLHQIHRRPNRDSQPDITAANMAAKSNYKFKPVTFRQKRESVDSYGSGESMNELDPEQMLSTMKRAEIEFIYEYLMNVQSRHPYHVEDYVHPIDLNRSYSPPELADSCCIVG